MLEFLHKYQEELFDEKRSKENEIKELELRQKEIEVLMEDVTSKEDYSFSMLSPLAIGKENQGRLLELTSSLNSTTESLAKNIEELNTIVQRIQKVQHLLVDMSDWTFDSLPEDEVPPEVRYGEEVVEKTDELLFGDEFEMRYDLAEKLQSIYEDIDIDPDLAKAELRGVIRRLMDER